MGVLRLFLALSVVAAHVGGGVLGVPGTYPDLAVNVFFVISGFYMALVLNTTYRDVPVRTFYANRFLRLFPVYWIGLVIGAVVWWPAIVQFVVTLSAWGRVYFFVANALLTGQDLPYMLCLPVTSGSGCADPVAFTIVPPSWTLSVELGFYAIAPFVVKSVRRTYLYVLVGALYLAVSRQIVVPGTFDLLGAKQPNSFSYFFYGASFMFFGLGALGYQLHTKRATFRFGWALLLVGAVSLTLTTMQFWMPLLIALAVPALFELTKRSRIDRTIGNLSYPMYVLHYPVLHALQRKLPADGWILDTAHIGTVVAVICIGGGLLLNATVDRSIDRFRHSLLLARPGGSPLLLRLRAIRPPKLRVHGAQWLRRGAIALYLLAPFALVAYALTEQSTRT